MKVLEFIFVYTLGALGYGGLEMLWRGRTHWTMLLLGGLCFLLMYLICTRLSIPLWRRWVLCAAAVTGLEFLTGCIVNRLLGWGVWDYSNVPGNLLGQICPVFSLYWLALAIPCSALAQAIRKFLFPA